MLSTRCRPLRLQDTYARLCRMLPLPILSHSPGANRDGFGRRVDYLRLSLTDRCNLRCTYCMPAEGVALQPREHLLTFEEIWRVAGAAFALGFRKFRITGGEPLVVRDIVRFVAGLRRVVGTSKIAMTTNAVRLAPLARPLREAGLQLLNISCDTLRADRFVAIARRPHLDDMLRGLDAALIAGFERVKINAVVLPGVNDDELVELARLTERFAVDVRFIEAMPQLGSPRAFVGADAMLKTLRGAFDLREVPPEDASQAARMVYTAPGLLGTLAFIAPLTHKFCAQCNRMRLTPQGELKGCLLTPGGMDLRDALRSGISDASLQTRIGAAIGQKPWAYDDDHHGLDRSMSAIGG